MPFYGTVVFLMIIAIFHSNIIGVSTILHLNSVYYSIEFLYLLYSIIHFSPVGCLCIEF